MQHLPSGSLRELFAINKICLQYIFKFAWQLRDTFQNLEQEIKAALQ
jgi:hypothetical protein